MAILHYIYLLVMRIFKLLSNYLKI